MVMPTVHIKIHGKVQGVGYRYHAAQKASLLGITGFVCNRDNHVEIRAQSAQKSKLDAFVLHCKRGPLLSKIERFEQEEVQNAEEFDEFEIL